MSHASYPDCSTPHLNALFVYILNFVTSPLLEWLGWQDSNLQPSD